MALEDDMMELMGMKHEENKSLWELVKRYHHVVLDLGAFNHPQALRAERMSEDRVLIVQFEKSCCAIIFHYVITGEEGHKD